MRQIPEADALRILAHGQERRACNAEMDLLAERHRQLSAQRDKAQGKIREIMKHNGLNPDEHAVVTAEDATFPFGTAVNVQTNQPIPDEPEQPAPPADESLPSLPPLQPASAADQPS